MSRENSDKSDDFGTSSSHTIHLHSAEDDRLPSKYCCSTLPRTRRQIRKICTTKQLKRRLPFLQWIPRCTFQSIFYDLLAGFTVALTAIPQGIAYGAVAGLPLEVVYTNFIQTYFSFFISYILYVE